MRGFSLIELLVVISIIALMITVAFPVVARMADSSRVSSGVQTISLAAEQARRYSVARTDKFGAASPPFSAEYSGVAMIVSPSGELRLVENDRIAANGAFYLEESYVGGERNGFKDIEGLDYIQLPGGADIYGINRNSNGDPSFLPPPFAIRFDRTGRLITGSSQGGGTDARLVFYDHNNDVRYQDVSRNDVAAYAPANPTANPYTKPAYDLEANWDPGFLRHELPFGVFESVPGVRVVKAGENPANPDSSYTDVFFSRYSGVALTIKREP